ncbi:uncharacterized protein BJ212DRAFT_1536049 [Suillus subaureus]|uniref:Uncharacterized protein n=1 Tax=Suillus subaureus TaxID=48587 RepID=A0A9P7E0L9_9AGAM|nr:uncharacterized protein BJ212DRAFT_1536049 [Suillus subaureus]KAG1807643.1 hypothetical protein BJ212DRAFT_1536049 [Suillus subaureus]
MGLVGYHVSSDSPVGDPSHPSMNPASDLDMQSHPMPLKSTSIPIPSQTPSSSTSIMAMSLLTPLASLALPASTPPSTPPPSEPPRLSSSLRPDITSPLSTDSKSAVPGQLPVVESEGFAELLGPVPRMGSPGLANESHCHDLEDSEYNKLLDEIIQWAHCTIKQTFPAYPHWDNPNLGNSTLRSLPHTSLNCCSVRTGRTRKKTNEFLSSRLQPNVDGNWFHSKENSYSDGGKMTSKSTGEYGTKPLYRMLGYFTLALKVMQLINNTLAVTGLMNIVHDMVTKLGIWAKGGANLNIKLPQGWQWPGIVSPHQQPAQLQEGTLSPHVTPGNLPTCTPSVNESWLVLGSPTQRHLQSLSSHFMSLTPVSSLKSLLKPYMSLDAQELTSFLDTSSASMGEEEVNSDLEDTFKLTPQPHIETSHTLPSTKPNNPIAIPTRSASILSGGTSLLHRFTHWADQNNIKLSTSVVQFLENSKSDFTEIFGVGPAEYTVIEQFCEDFGLKPRLSYIHSQHTILLEMPLGLHETPMATIQSAFHNFFRDIPYPKRQLINVNLLTNISQDGAIPDLRISIQNVWDWQLTLIIPAIGKSTFSQHLTPLYIKLKAAVAANPALLMIIMVVVQELCLYFSPKRHSTAYNVLLNEPKCSWDDFHLAADGGDPALDRPIIVEGHTWASLKSVHLKDPSIRFQLEIDNFIDSLLGGMTKTAYDHYQKWHNSTLQPRKLKHTIHCAGIHEDAPAFNTRAQKRQY